MVVWNLSALPASVRGQVGGKAAALAQMRQAGYPVPRGFVIPPAAFVDGTLAPQVWEQVAKNLDELRHGHAQPAFAVRSSAIDEDSLSASFAGEFESVIDVRTNDEVRQAIFVVYQSQFSDRVSAYRQIVKNEERGEPNGSLEAGEAGLAVIIQELVPARYAGVLFTADPLSGSHERMTGNFVPGLGEGLVSGEVDARPFAFIRPSGAYEGPDELRPWARRLYKTAESLIQDLGGPLDIEWAVDDAGLHILQARPVTTMQAYDPIRGDWNDSRRGEYLWSNSNFGEAFPDVMTPLTWSQVQIYAQETFGNPLPENHPLFGNIGGRLYFNLAIFSAIFKAFGMSRERMNVESEEFFGTLPPDIDIPVVPFKRLAVIRRWVPYSIRAILRRWRNLRALDQFTADLPRKTTGIRAKISAAGTPAELAVLWREEFEPLMRKSYQMLQAGTSRYENAYRPLRRALLKQVGAEDANLLLSDVSMQGGRLASLRPLVGLSQVASGEMSRQEYLQTEGHRGPHEMELSIPRPAEYPGWLDDQLASLEGTDVAALLARRESERAAAWARYEARFPKEAPKTARKLAQAAEAARGREAIRSAETKLYGENRAFALKAGELTGRGDDLFFLWLDELLALLDGEETAVAHIPVRRAAHERLSDLPSYPAVIVGRFDPAAWAADPHRRSDIYDPRAAQDRSRAAETSHISGYPGSAGVAEGVVRLLENSEEGHLLRPGEVLVATTTNIGWTPLFPRAAAIVTDVGAPLSHTAIVARELGLPAVVGTGDATMRLQTGDRVRVDGTAGTVEKLEKITDAGDGPQP